MSDYYRCFNCDKKVVPPWWYRILRRRASLLCFKCHWGIRLKLIKPKNAAR